MSRAILQSMARLVLTSSFAEQRKPFQPPSSDRCLRFTTTIDLVTPTDASPRETAHTHKSAVHLPISRLPLNDAAAVHRFKLLAGPRWIPPKSAVLQQEGKEQDADADEEHGWFKMSQDSFGEVRLNRQWLMDTIQRLVKEANVSTLMRGCSTIYSSSTFLSQLRLPSLSKNSHLICATCTLVSVRSEIPSGVSTSGPECRPGRRRAMEEVFRVSPRNGCNIVQVMGRYNGPT